MRNCAKALAIIAVLAIGGCAKEYGRNDKELLEKLFDSWIGYYYGEDGKTGLQATPVGDMGVMLLGDETVGDGDTWIPAFRFVKVTYTITDLDGNIISTTDENTARRIGSYARGNYYGPRVWYVTDGSYGCYAGVAEALKGMKIGGKRKVAIPSWLITTDRYSTKQQYIDKTDSSAESYIYDFELLGISADAFQTEIDSIEVYVNRNFAEEYRDSTAYDAENGYKRGFYFESLGFGSPSGKTSYNMPADPANYEMPLDTTIYVNYTGRLLNGMVFDTSEADTAKVYGLYSASTTYAPLPVVLYEKYSEITLNGSTTITGFSGALSKLHPYEKARTVFYSLLGYNYTGTGNSSPPFSPLIFDIRVVEAP